MNVPIEVYDLLERRLGREDALAVAKSIEGALSHIEERSREIAAQRKIEVKDALRDELRQELATKEDLARVEGSLREDLAKLEGSLRGDLAKLEGSLREDLAKLEGSFREELMRLEGTMNARFERQDKKFTLFFAVLVFTIVFLNQDALEFLARLLGLLR